MFGHIDGQVCGRDYTVAKPIIIHANDRKRASNRYLVDGVTRANGDHIRFKSLAKAELHMRNMRLAED